jgi:hypothetical protein
MKSIKIIIISLLLYSFSAPSYQIAVLKYRGGGDWYANPTSLTNLIQFCNEELGCNIEKQYATVEVSDPAIFNYPFLHMTGHGNVIFSTQEAENLRNYLLAGGFLHIDDNYGMDAFIRPEMKKVFPELEWEELSWEHPIYHQSYSFPDGLPKIHVHDAQLPQGLGLVHEGRLLCFYSYESDLGDGWEDQAVHNNSEATRLKALQMGANILQYAFIGEK